MKGSRLHVAVLAGVAAIAVAGSAMAAETSPHKGFFIGGGVLTGAETGPINGFGGGAAARLGYGVTDKVLVYLDNNYFFTRKSGANWNFFDTQARVQVFPYGNWYLATGGGLAVGSVGVVGARSTKAGIGTTTSTGYEFRPKDNLAISVESGFNYKRISGTNFYTPVLLGRLDWYF